MTPLSRHDQVLLAITAGVVLFGGVLAFAGRQAAAIRARRAEIARLEDRLALQRELVAARDLWDARYEKVRDRMRVFRPGDQVETFWLNLMDRAAEEHGVLIRQRDLKEEAVVAGVCELPIEVRNWEAPLEPFVKFVHRLESAGAMLELRELRVSPVPNRQGWLKGSFLLFCAYLRADDGAAAPAATESDTVLLPASGDADGDSAPKPAPQDGPDAGPEPVPEAGPDAGTEPPAVAE